ncbi:MAG: MFS transporter [Anaerolineaceae bacterium]|nr:MFS transporter [Anaerolineaceae bacterium]
MKKLSILRLLVIASLGFALTFTSNIQEPLQAFKSRQLAPDMPNTALGFVGFVGLLVAMVVQPIVGVFSDRAHTKLGRRLPYIISGGILISIATFLLAAAPTLWFLFVIVIFSQFSSNILQGPWQALIPDLVPEEQRGLASSLKAVLDIIAMIAGGAVAGMLLGRVDTWGQTAVYAAAATPTILYILFITITAIWAREAPGAVDESVAQKTVGDALKKAFYVNFKEHPVFGWWFANRILFWGGFIAVNTFLINYLIDVINMTNSEAQAFFGQLKVTIGVALIFLALIAGKLADKFGRKPVMIASGLIALVGTLLILLVRGEAMLTIAGAIVGMGVGTFLSASWALATDIVPKGEAARYLGIANIATCIGSGSARLLGGVIIDPINRLTGSTASGYIFLYALVAVAFLVSVLVLIPLPDGE